MPSNGTRRSFAVRAWIALAGALFLVSSAVAAADAPGTTIAAAPAAARISAAAPNAAALDAEARYAGDGLADRGLGAQRDARQAAANLEGGTAQAAGATTTTTPAAGGQAAAAAPRVYAGKNHFWYPALGINQPVGWFACDSPNAPGPLVYRWGCAGANNVYLLAHAGGKFQPIYNAYYAHRLKTGQLAVYADPQGRVHYFKLAWYKVTPPLASSHWAWDPQPVGSLTLQTCLGANSELRLFVRFVEVPRP